MKLAQIFFLIVILSSTLSVYGQEKASKDEQITSEQMVEALKPRTHCRFVPEREDDFAFENNYIAMRFYGPALRDGTEDAGADCWLKRVEYPIIDKWYKLSSEGHSYHEDRGEGYDNYKVGTSAGTGGTAIWLDGKRLALNTFTQWKILENTPQRCSFVLTYEAEIAVRSIRKKRRLPLR